jgi:hypothetical protein
MMRVSERMFCAELCAIGEETRRLQGTLYLLRCTLVELSKKLLSRSHAENTERLSEDLGSHESFSLSPTINVITPKHVFGYIKPTSGECSMITYHWCLRIQIYLLNNFYEAVHMLKSAISHV